MQAAASTYNSIENALKPLHQSINFEIYLQGSYRNSTNIRADSDVDVVFELRSLVFSNIQQLSPNERSLYDQAYKNATYGLMEFRRDVLWWRYNNITAPHLYQVETNH